MKETAHRWRIRRTRPGRWEVHLRLAGPLPGIGYVHVPLGVWPTWVAASAYVQRADTQNYGKAAA